MLTWSCEMVQRVKIFTTILISFAQSCENFAWSCERGHRLILHNYANILHDYAKSILKTIVKWAIWTTSHTHAKFSHDCAKLMWMTAEISCIWTISHQHANFRMTMRNSAKGYNKRELSWLIRMYLRIFAWLCQVLSKEESGCNTLHLLV